MTRSMRSILRGLGILCLMVVFLGGCDARESEGGGNGASASGDAQAAAPSREVRRYDIEDLMDSVTYRGLSFSPDGTRMLTSNNATGVYNAVAVPIDGGDPVPLTTSKKESVFAVSYFPDDERILYTADQGGNEMRHLYVRELDGNSKDLTPGERYMANFAGWNPDGKSFYIQTNQRNMRHFDLYEILVDGYETKLVFQNDDYYTIGPASPDRKHLILSKAPDNRSRHLILHDLETGENVDLTPANRNIASHPQAFSPDGKYLYYTTDKWEEFQYLMRYDREAKTHEKLLQKDWDIRGVSLSKDGSRLLVRINENARTVVEVYDTASFELKGRSRTPDASVASSAMSGDGTKLGMIVTNGRIPGDVYVQDIGGAAPRRLLASLSPKIEADDLVPGEVVRFSSFDGLTVPGILYRPHGASETNLAPAMVSVHGGPGGESRIGYNARIQYLVNNGYAVFAINNRGSSGSGKTFFHLDDMNHGSKDLDDIVSSKQFLIDLGYVARNKVGIIGGSYGGYMTLAALAFRPLVFDVGVDLYGVANWHATFANHPPWWAAGRSAMETEMGDYDDLEHWMEVSPLFHIEKIVKPVIVLQGANDPRVQLEVSDEVVAKLKKAGVPHEYVVFPDEGHGFRKKSNQITSNKAILNFLDRYLRGNTP